MAAAESGAGAGAEVGRRKTEAERIDEEREERVDGAEGGGGGTGAWQCGSGQIMYVGSGSRFWDPRFEFVYLFFG